MTTVEVYADITCPFAYVGLEQLADHVGAMVAPPDVIVRPWPLEWVNGTALAADAVIAEVGELTEQLGIDAFRGLDAEHWPASSIPALELVTSAYRRDAATGWTISMELRRALFERGEDISDPAVLAALAEAHDLPAPQAEPSGAVRNEYENGKARGVKGSPHFYVGSDDFFCPSLDLGHDADGHLTARFDADMLARFFACIDA